MCFVLKKKETYNTIFKEVSFFFVSFFVQGKTYKKMLVENVYACADIVDQLLTENNPIAVDFEGVDLCRKGELCFVQIATSDKTVYLIDICAIGRNAFHQGRLKELFESNVLKLWWDVRTDTDLLYHVFKVCPRNVYDVQVAYCKTEDVDNRRGRKNPFLVGLGKAMSQCPNIDASERQHILRVKKKGAELFVPENGGSYETWKKRPLPQTLFEYAVCDVYYLHVMYEQYPIKEEFMNSVVKTRIEFAMQSKTALKGKHMAMKDF